MPKAAPAHTSNVVRLHDARPIIGREAVKKHWQESRAEWLARSMPERSPEAVMLTAILYALGKGLTGKRAFREVRQQLEQSATLHNSNRDFTGAFAMAESVADILGLS